MSGFKFYPQNCVWEVTFACNMRCLHCGTSAGTIRQEELSTSEALAVVDELADLDCEMVTLSGGEPLLRRDWRELAARIRERNMRSFIISNGYAVTQEIVDDFKRLCFEMVGISFDGTEETHNYIRQRENSYERALNAMRMMHDSGVRFCAVSQISNLNIGELDDIRQLLIDVGCKLWRIQMTTSTGRMAKDLVLTLDRFPQLVNKILEYQQDSTILIDVGENIGYYGCKGTKLWENEPYLGCYAGTRVVGIASNGDVKGCLSMQDQFIEGNIRDTSLTEIWNNPDGFAYNRKFTRDSAGGACRDCRYLPLCRAGCATTAVSATGCRGDNPYCIYQVEQRQGIEPRDTSVITQLLARIEEQEQALAD